MHIALRAGPPLRRVSDDRELRRHAIDLKVMETEPTVGRHRRSDESPVAGRSRIEINKARARRATRHAQPRRPPRHALNHRSRQLGIDIDPMPLHLVAPDITLSRPYPVNRHDLDTSQIVQKHVGLSQVFPRAVRRDKPPSADRAQRDRSARASRKLDPLIQRHSIDGKAQLSPRTRRRRAKARRIIDRHRGREPPIQVQINRRTGRRRQTVDAHGSHNRVAQTLPSSSRR